MTDNRALRELVEKYDEHMQAIGGCSDGGCVIVKPKGMHTNGGCRCLRDHLKAQRLAHAAMNLRKGVAAILERPVVVGGWLPIESAPKDTSVIAYHPMMGRFLAYNKTIDAEYVAYCWCSWSGGSGIMPPTHWMPLPAAPQPNESMVRGKS